MKKSYNYSLCFNIRIFLADFAWSSGYSPDLGGLFAWGAKKIWRNITLSALPYSNPASASDYILPGMGWIRKIIIQSVVYKFMTSIK